MDWVARSRHPARGHGAHRRADHRSGPPAVRGVGPGTGRRLGRRCAHLPPDHLAGHYPGRQLTRGAACCPRGRNGGLREGAAGRGQRRQPSGGGLRAPPGGTGKRAQRALLIGAAVLTVVLSWTVMNTVYTLRYADQHFRSKAGGIAFGDQDGHERPSYRDFAYVAFTIGMTYQVSDTTLRDTRIRRTVLAHAILSYLFGVVIVAGSVSLISGLIR